MKRADSWHVETGVRLRASDGVELVMDIYFPDDGKTGMVAPCPVIVERTPYLRANPRMTALGEEAARRGYVMVSQDVRGRGDSGGRFRLQMNHPDEGMDGSETLEWVLMQPWCNGRIGTMGLSFSSANQSAVALNHPRGLVAQVQFDSGVNYHRRMYRYDGACNIGVILPWILSHGAKSAPSPEIAVSIEAMRTDVAGWIDSLPLKRGETPLALLPDYEDIYFTILERAHLDDYWRNPSIYLEDRWDDYPKDVAVLLITGWFAHHCGANFEKLEQLGTRLERPVRLIVGPWVHGQEMGEISHAGDVEFGADAARFGPGSRIRLDWMDEHLREGGQPGSGQPAIRYFCMGGGDGHVTAEGRIFHGGSWRSSDSWPPRQTRYAELFLHPGGELTPRQPAAGVAASEYAFDPRDPCPGIGGSNIAAEHMPDFVRPGPRLQRGSKDFAACRGSQAPLRGRRDLLVFETSALETDVEITGPVRLKLFVSSTAPDTDFHARLIDIYPESAAHPQGLDLLISEGIVRMRYRNGRDTEELIEPGVLYEVMLDMGQTSNVFRRGHRIALHLTSACFPQYDVNPNTGEKLGRHTHTQVARQTIHHAASASSALILPLQTGFL